MIKRVLLLVLMLFTTRLANSQTARIRIILVGDSTVAANNGWGPGFCADVTAEVTCINMAKNGRSTSSYRAEKSWDEVLNTLKQNREFDATWVFIQFGHNDQPGKPGRSTDLATEFLANMRRYAQEVRAAGAQPVLITPLTRRSFKDGKLKNDLEPWASATKKVAAEEKVPVLDLNALSFAAVHKMGPIEANKLAMVEPPEAVKEAALHGNSISVPADPPTQFDYTHLGPAGAVFFGRMVADQVSKMVSPLKPYIRQ